MTVCPNRGQISKDAEKNPGVCGEPIPESDGGNKAPEAAGKRKQRKLALVLAFSALVAAAVLCAFLILPSRTPETEIPEETVDSAKPLEDEAPADTAPAAETADHTPEQMNARILDVLNGTFGDERGSYSVTFDTDSYAVYSPDSQYMGYLKYMDADGNNVTGDENAASVSFTVTIWAAADEEAVQRCYEWFDEFSCAVICASEGIGDAAGFAEIFNSDKLTGVRSRYFETLHQELTFGSGTVYSFLCTTQYESFDLFELNVRYR